MHAQAAAQAIIEGNCLTGQAVAQLLLEADAMDVTAGSTCGGLAEVNVTPSTSTYTGPYGDYYGDAAYGYSTASYAGPYVYDASYDGLPYGYYSY